MPGSSLLGAFVKHRLISQGFAKAPGPVTWKRSGRIYIAWTRPLRHRLPHPSIKLWLHCKWAAFMEIGSWERQTWKDRKFRTGYAARGPFKGLTHQDEINFLQQGRAFPCWDWFYCPWKNPLFSGFCRRQEVILFFSCHCRVSAEC